MQNSTKFKPKWYNVELHPISAELFKDFLREKRIRFETSTCYNLVHFEVYIFQEKQIDVINSFLFCLP